MDGLNRMSSFFNERERRRLNKKIQEETKDGLPNMTEDEIRLSCLENNGYETPELNDKLYLHFRGFRKIENLDKYTGCKSLWLESNGFYKIENLERLTELRCLYLAKNLLTKIEGLDSLVHLTILDVSNNRLTSIENISCCPNLQTLNVSHNAIATPEAVVEIKNCPNLNNIDFTSNRLEMTDAFLEIFAEVPSLRSLSLNGNELTKMQTFRKKMIVSVPQLSYLDRPIDEQERFFANAFAKGGQEGEMAARTEWKEMQTKKRVDEMEQFRKWQQEQKELRDAAREANKTVSPMFTPEEIEARQQEADAAHEEERRLLELGISNLATKYWEVDTKHGKSIDALAEAAKQILENSEKQKENMSETSSTLDGTEISMDNNAGSAFGDFTERVAEDLTEDTFEKEDMLRQASLVKKLTTKSITTAEREEDVLHEVTTTEEITVEISDTEDQVALMNKKKEEEEQLIREQRVQESLAIYKQQLKDLEEGKVRGSHSATSTWNDAVQSENVPENKQADAPLFWSEEMDFELARLVKDCVFDFDDISSKIGVKAQSGKLGMQIKDSARKLTSEECRMRWSQLDAAQWSELSPNTSALDTVFKVCINSSVLGAGHGAQPSFQAMASLAAGSMPTYLKPPTSFPSVRDEAEEEDEFDKLD